MTPNVAGGALTAAMTTNCTVPRNQCNGAIAKHHVFGVVDNKSGINRIYRVVKFGQHDISLIFSAVFLRNKPFSKNRA